MNHHATPKLYSPISPMNKPIQFTMDDLRKWILAQPDDKAVDMREIHSYDDCGCILLQYGRNLGFQPPFFCGTEDIYNDGNPLYAGRLAEGDVATVRPFIMRCLIKLPSTFGQVKTLLPN